MLCHFVSHSGVIADDQCLVASVASAQSSHPSAPRQIHLMRPFSIAVGRAFSLLATYTLSELQLKRHNLFYSTFFVLLKFFCFLTKVKVFHQGHQTS